MQISVLEFFDRTLSRCPAKTGVTDATSSYTFAQMAERAARIGSRIVARADVMNSPVAVFLPKSCNSIISFLGILMSGNLYMPLDLKFPQTRVRRIIENIGPALVITDQKHVAAIEACGVTSDRIVAIDAEDDAPAMSREELDRRRAVLIDTDPVYIINTSGSTGVPKGVVISHRGVIDYIDWAIGRFGFGDDLVIGSQAPFCFDNSTLDIYLSWALGGTLVLIPEELFSFPVKLMQYVAQKEITFFFWVPSVMISVAAMNILDSVACPKLKYIFFAGEVMTNKHLNYWRRHIPAAVYANLYGPTEITVDCTYYVVDREFADDDPLPIGIPCRNSDVLILNDQNQACKPGEQGELCVRGSSLALGYWNDPEKTAKAFTQNPLNPHYPEVIYRTGDLVYTNERGEIMFTGRKDFQIKHMGYRIELAEIEHQILCIEGIANACVVYNKDKKEITLFFESNDGEMSPTTIRKALADVFPKYMWPTAFHPMAELPRNASGKIDRQTLLQSIL